MLVPKLRAPIILTHGLLGFNHIRLCGLTLANYFPGIPEFLQQAGNRVVVAGVSPTGGVAQRAKDLRKFIEREVPHEAVHILAHSMGGLDARYMISKLGMADRVLTLTTLGTPHRGSSFADWAIRRLDRLVRPLFQLCGVPHQAFHDLTTTRCKQFNDEVPDAPSVRYFSVGGHFPTASWAHPMCLSQQYVSQAEGPNDGVVSLDSARYGEEFEVWDGDHLSLVNWPEATNQPSGKTVDRRADYIRLLGRLATAGF